MGNTNEENVIRAISDYKSGKGLNWCAKAYALNAGKLRDEIVKAGGTIRPKGRPKKTNTDSGGKDDSGDVH